MNRRETIVALAALGAVPLAVEAQQAAKTARIGDLAGNLAGTPHLPEANALGLTVPPSLLQCADEVMQ
jgi:hypothetical protein